ncbi:dephospho-CoA kinase [Legionella busanensis]|uniref:Dephospho-CoA kinase n=2 Tax=Legionella busanensis TaxID=190655 RepID=A0A378JME8_9GAMM|nr:dephospho-CoA kinase [Legionella busanensis]
MFCIGLTGNIGSGKSTAISFFKSLGATVIIADEIARQITAPAQPALQKIIEHFGLSVITSEGQLNRAQLREIIFNNKEERLWLESLLHPLIRQTIENKIKNSQGPYCVIEIPLLTNRKDYPYLDRILVIFASPTMQVNRVVNRDSCSKEQVFAMLATQPQESLRLQLADDILLNDSSLEQLEANIRKLHGKYLQLAYEKSS